MAKFQVFLTEKEEHVAVNIRLVQGEVPTLRGFIRLALPSKASSDGRWKFIENSSSWMF